MLPSNLTSDVGAALAATLVRAGRGLVRGVAIVGSNVVSGQGMGRDLDVLVLVEPPPAEVPWPRARLTEALGWFYRAAGRQVGGLPLDLNVRTIDRFEEARTVIGGIEHLASERGRWVFREPYSRRAVVSTTQATVRLEIAAGWFDSSIENIHLAAAAMNRAVLVGQFGPPAASEYEWRIKKAQLAATNALCTFAGLRFQKTDSLAGVWPLLRRRLPGAVTDELVVTLSSREAAPKLRHVLAMLIPKLFGAACARRYRIRLETRLHAPVVTLSGGPITG